MECERIKVNVCVDGKKGGLRNALSRKLNTEESTCLLEELVQSISPQRSKLDRCLVILAVAIDIGAGIRVRGRLGLESEQKPRERRERYPPPLVSALVCMRNHAITQSIHNVRMAITVYSHYC